MFQETTPVALSNEASTMHFIYSGNSRPRQGCIYVDSHLNLRRNLGQLRIKRQIDSQLCESKINENMPSKRLIHKNFVERND